MHPSTLMELKGPSGRIPPGPKDTYKTSFVEAAAKESKEKLAPNHYPAKNVAAGHKYAQEDMTGQYQRGLAKTTLEQLRFVSDARAHAEDSPQPGHYAVKHVSSSIQITFNIHLFLYYYSEAGGAEIACSQSQQG